MHSERQSEPHRHMALAETQSGAVPAGAPAVAARAETRRGTTNRVAASRSLLLLSLAGRLLLVLVASGLLWGAVFFAVR
jgi:hypothetical protein